MRKARPPQMRRHKRLGAKRPDLGEGGLRLPDQNEIRGPRRAAGAVGRQARKLRIENDAAERSMTKGR